MATQPEPRITPEQYLEIERKAEHRSEYFQGEMFAMSGGTIAHSLIAANIVGALHSQLRGRPCTVLTADMRVLVDRSGLYTYPDVSVVCGPARFEDEVRDTLLNPTLIVEVLSASTEAYDRGQKFRRYREIESLRAYLLASSVSMALDLFTRDADGRWTLVSADHAEDALTLEAVGCTLSVAEVYEKVEFQPA